MNYTDLTGEQKKAWLAFRDSRLDDDRELQQLIDWRKEAETWQERDLFYDAVCERKDQVTEDAWDDFLLTDLMSGDDMMPVSHE